MGIPATFTSKSRQSHSWWWVIAHQADDVEPSITVTGMCPAVERDSSGYISGFPSRGLKYISENILTPKMYSKYLSVQPPQGGSTSVTA
jgi:hypothetical protein